LRYKKFEKRKTKISKKYAKMMEFHEKFLREGRSAKEGGGAWFQSMHPLYIPSICQRPPPRPPRPHL
jgi:hypothetical protein